MGLVRKLFGPSREEIWRQLSTEIGGRYVEGTFWKGEKVEARHDEWTVTLDTMVVSTGKVVIVYTRIRAPYINQDGFRFKIYRKSVLSGVGKALGMQDVEVGDPVFDDHFIVKGNDEAKLRELFSRPRIRELIEQQPDIHFGVKDDEGWFGPTFPENVDKLEFLVTGIIKDVARLKLLYELFAETLEELCRIGSAQTSAPDVKL